MKLRAQRRASHVVARVGKALGVTSLADWGRPGTPGDLGAAVPIGVALPFLDGHALGPVGALELKIARGVPEQILDGRGRVVGGRTIMPHDAVAQICPRWNRVAAWLRDAERILSGG